VGGEGEYELLNRHRYMNKQQSIEDNEEED